MLLLLRKLPDIFGDSADQDHFLVGEGGKLAFRGVMRMNKPCRSMRKQSSVRSDMKFTCGNQN